MANSFTNFNKPIDWPNWLHVTGYWFLEQMQDYQPPKELVDFIHEGPPPIYIGFGSMTPQNPDLSSRLATAIQVVVSDEAMRTRAIALGNRIKEENGVANAVNAFQRHLKC